jgi:uncharacterized protein
MAGQVVHFEVVGSDGAALRSFYGDVFGWKLNDVSTEGVDYGLTEPEQTGIGGGIGAAPPGSAGHVTFYIQVPDLDATLAMVGSLGGKTVMPPMEVAPGTTIATFTDPEGHLVGLTKGD